MCVCVCVWHIWISGLTSAVVLLMSPWALIKGLKPSRVYSSYTTWQIYVIVQTNVRRPSPRGFASLLPQGACYCSGRYATLHDARYCRVDKGILQSFIIYSMYCVAAYRAIPSSTVCWLSTGAENGRLYICDSHGIELNILLSIWDSIEHRERYHA